MKNMKHTSVFKVLALFAFVFTAFACSNIFNKLDETNADTKSYISIKAGGLVSRTILSDAFDLNDSKMSFALAGYIGENKIVEKEWATYQEMTEDKLEIKAGTYNFTLTATYKNDDEKTVVFEDTTENVVVESGKTTALNFTLKEKAYNLTGQGTVNVTAKFPSDFGAVRAVVSLHDFETFPAADSILKDNGNALEWEFGTAEYKAGKGDAVSIGDITSDSSGDMSFQYTENLDAGNYFLKISFYGDGGVTEIKPGYAEALEIRSGRTSAKTIETDGVHSHTINTGEWSKDGTYHWHAANCGIEAHNTDKSAHAFSDDLTSDDTHHWHECICGAKSEEAKHDWNEGEVTTPATTRNKNGVKTYTCKICAATKTEEFIETKTVPASAVSLNELGAKRQLDDSELETYGINGSSVPAKIDGATYYMFGVYPQTILKGDVSVDETIINLEFDEGDNYPVDYYLGSDNQWYAKCTENAYEAGYTYSDGNPVAEASTDSIKYFKVEPIVWRKLGSSGYLLAEKALTANVAYYPYNSVGRYINENRVYPNNYEHSRIRAFLNGYKYVSKESYNEDFYNKGFLQTAFTPNHRDQIQITTVDNSDASTTDATGKVTKPTQSVCPDTQDKIFLLSELEATTIGNGFAGYRASGTGNTRIRMPTDYAKANHALQDTKTSFVSYWWLRSPYYYNSNPFVLVRAVIYDGDTYYSGVVHNLQCGVVPALKLIEN